MRRALPEAGPAALFLFLCRSLPAAGQAPAATSQPTDLVDALNGVFGKQTYGRAVHAKGIDLDGTFTPSRSAASVSRAPHLQKTAVPVVIRFSNFAGIPTIPDTHDAATPRGISLKFRLPDGSETDLVMHSFNGFPAPTADEFRRFLVALGTSGPGVASPKPIETYLAAHPVAKTFVETQGPPPASYGAIPYFGVNTFKFTSARGEVTFGRYRLEPVARVEHLSKEQAAAARPDYLSEEIRTRVAKGPVRFRLLLQIAGAGDRIEDPTIAWPETRRKVELGVLEVRRPVADNDAAEKRLLFLPTALPPGIEPADPMITFRGQAYPISFDRRHP